MERNWQTFTSKFLLNDTEDEMFKEFDEDVICIDLNTVTAYYPSKYDDFIKVDTDFGVCYCLKITMSEFTDKLKSNYNNL